MFKKFRHGKRANVGGAVAGIAITLVIGIVMFTATMLILGPWVSQATEAQQATNLTINSGTLATYVSMLNTSIVNESQYIGNSTVTFAQGTDYIMNDTDGTVLFYESANGEADTDYNASYLWIHPNYLNNAGERAIATVLPLLVSVGMLLVIVGIMFKSGIVG